MNFSVAELSAIDAIAASPYFAAALIVFFLSSGLFALLVQRRNGFSLRDTVLCLVGLKRFHRTVTINLCQVLGLLASPGLAAAAAATT